MIHSFVKTDHGNFPNQNFYLAWRGFVEMGYDVIKFEEKELDEPEIWKTLTKETPVFAGVKVFDRIVKQLGVDYHRTETYPEILWPFMFRKIEKTTLGIAKKTFASIEKPMFIKPVNSKIFTGVLLKSFLDLIPLTNIPDNTEIYVVDPINFLSEFRVYVNDSEIIGVKHYCGDWMIVPQESTITEIIKKFSKTAPTAYALDIGVVIDPNIKWKRDVLVEVNDATSLGNYGLDCIHYAEMLASRWFEIMA